MIESKQLKEKHKWTNIYAIDPGNKESGFAHIRDGSLVRCGKFLNEDLRQQLFLEIGCCSETEDVVIIEGMKAYGRAGADVFETCYEIGKFIDRVQTRTSAPMLMVYRNEVKQEWLGTSRGSDADIRNALIEHYGGYREVPKKKGGTKKEVPEALAGVKADAWSALAIGLLAYRRHCL